MLWPRPRLGTALFLVLSGGSLSVPRDAHATIGNVPGVVAGFSMFLYNVCAPLGGTLFLCTQSAIRMDPVGTVKAVSMTLDYDFSGPTFTFNAGLSGPLCSFSVGGSCPPATPGSGTQPLPIFPALPDVAGLPLPASIYSLVDNGLTVTLNYVLPAPIPVPAEENFFLLVFNFITPTVFDAATAAVTYSTGVLPGADFVLLSSSCDSGDPADPLCGTLVPAVSIAFAPEPSTTALLALGVTGLALTAARRRRGARRPS
jgi:hypothetical protein